MKSTIVGLWTLFVLTVTYLLGYHYIVSQKMSKSVLPESTQTSPCNLRCDLARGYASQGKYYSIHDMCPKHAQAYRGLQYMTDNSFERSR